MTLDEILSRNDFLDEREVLNQRVEALAGKIAKKMFDLETGSFDVNNITFVMISGLTFPPTLAIEKKDGEDKTIYVFTESDIKPDGITVLPHASTKQKIIFLRHLPSIIEKLKGIEDGLVFDMKYMLTSVKDY